MSETRVTRDRSKWGMMLHRGIDILFHAPFFNLENVVPIAEKLGTFMDWTIPSEYNLEVIQKKHFSMELLSNSAHKKDKLIIQFHGGGYLIRYVNMYRDQALRYAKLLSADVLSFDYRVAPHNVYPAALEDAIDTWEYAISLGYKPENIVFIGDSAGGNLAMALTLYLRDKAVEQKIENVESYLPRALVLMSPWADMSFSTDSYVRNNDSDPFFGRQSSETDPTRVPRPLTFAYAGDIDLKDPRLSPTYANFDYFPETLVQVGTCEILEDDSQNVYNNIVKCGGVAKLTRYENMFHVFQISAPHLEESKIAYDEIKEFVDKFRNIP